MTLIPNFYPFALPRQNSISSLTESSTSHQGFHIWIKEIVANLWWNTEDMVLTELSAWSIWALLLEAVGKRSLVSCSSIWKIPYTFKTGTWNWRLGQAGPHIFFSAEMFFVWGAIQSSWNLKQNSLVAGLPSWGELILSMSSKKADKLFYAPIFQAQKTLSTAQCKYNKQPIRQR